MKKKGVIIQASSRANGNTHRVVSFVKERTGFDSIDLSTKKIGHYDYQFKNNTDDFLPLIKKITEEYEVFIFATPVYWYAMSGILKVFMDRITDCLQIEKEIGRKLSQKSMGMISCGSDSELKDGFTMPFKETANYLQMSYLGDVHTWIENDAIPTSVKNELIRFSDQIQ